LTYKYYAEVNIDEEIYCNSVTNSNNFEIFTTNVNERKKITGFKFKFEYDEEIDINKNFDHTPLNKLTHYYLDFLSSITLYPLTKIYYETKVFDLNGNRVITINRQNYMIPVRTYVDLDLSKYYNTLFDVSDKKIENFRYYYAEVLFYNNRLYDFSIREFFKIIEDDKSIKGYDDYCLIRDLFSHNYDILDRASKRFRCNSNLKNKFDYKELMGKDNKIIVIIDRYNYKNISELIQMAKDLKAIVEPLVLN
jgi:hypothetical protein